MLWTELGRFGRGFDPWFDVDRYEHLGQAGCRTIDAGKRVPVDQIWVDGDEAILKPPICRDRREGCGDIERGRQERESKGLAETGAGRGGETYHRRERWHGQFGKPVELPFNIEADAVEARFQKGVLRVTLPKAQADRPRTIKVKSE